MEIVTTVSEGLQNFNLIKFRSPRLLLKDLTKPHIKVKSGDLSIMHDYIVIPSVSCLLIG